MKKIITLLFAGLMAFPTLMAEDSNVSKSIEAETTVVYGDIVDLTREEMEKITAGKPKK